MTIKLTEQKFQSTDMKFYAIVMCADLLNPNTDEKGMTKLLNLTRFVSCGEISIETWYDRISKNWITQVKENGYEIECDYNGNIDSASFSHLMKIQKFFGKTKLVGQVKLSR